MTHKNVVVDDEGETIRLPPAVRDRAEELRRRDAEREARRAQQVIEQARDILRRLGKGTQRALQEPDVQREFLRLLQEADTTDYRKGHYNPRRL